MLQEFRAFYLILAVLQSWDCKDFNTASPGGMAYVCLLLAYLLHNQSKVHEKPLRKLSNVLQIAETSSLWGQA